jgi:pantetheine-phosphate adenylyltransferase
MTSSSRLAICAGSFDPITNGHVDIIRRALSLADRVVVAVGHTSSQTKKGLFEVEERLELIREVFADEPRIEVDEFGGLLVDYAGRRQAGLIVRGIRGVRDFDYEFQLALMNRSMAPGVETVFLAPDPVFAAISSSLVREISALGGDVTGFVPTAVAKRIASRDSAVRTRG